MIKQPYLGGHVSAAGGIANAIANAENMGAQCFQIFGASPRQWSGRVPSHSEVESYLRAQKESGIGPAFLHASYMVNLASANEQSWSKSVESLVSHFRIAQSIGAQGLIFHLGSCIGCSTQEGITMTLQGIKAVLSAVPGDTRLIMENSAGGGTKLGARVSDFKALVKGAASPRVKVCIDTAHIFESGLLPEFSSAGIKSFFDEWEKEVGISEIAALHINDSKTAAFSHMDRHENLGQGKIGLDGFKNLAAEKRLWHAAWILEVPGFDEKGPDKKNLDILKACFD